MPDGVIERVNTLGKDQPTLMIFQDRRNVDIVDYDPAFDSKDDYNSRGILFIETLELLSSKRRYFRLFQSKSNTRRRNSAVQVLL